MKKLLLSLLVLAGLSLILACDNEEEKQKDTSKVETPTPKDSTSNGSGVDTTKTGEGTMGAIINGVKWVAGYSNPVGVKPAYGSVSGDYLFIYGYKTVSGTTITAETIQIFVKAKQPGTYLIGTINGVVNNYAVYTKSVTVGSSSTTQTFYSYTDTSAGTFTLTKYDAVNKIISGTFNFKAVATDPKTSETTTVQVTKGVFDIKYP